MDYRPGYSRERREVRSAISAEKILASGEPRLHLNHQTRSIGIVFSRVKRRQLMFPLKKDMDPFLDEFACETAQYNDHTHDQIYPPRRASRRRVACHQLRPFARNPRS